MAEAAAKAAYEEDSQLCSVVQTSGDGAQSIRERFGLEFGLEFGAAAGLDDLRRLRRRYALLLHPDRAPPTERASAEAFMAEVNAAIDKAIRSRAPSAKA